MAVAELQGRSRGDGLSQRGRGFLAAVVARWASGHRVCVASVEHPTLGAVYSGRCMCLGTFWGDAGGCGLPEQRSQGQMAKENIGTTHDIFPRRLCYTGHGEFSSVYRCGLACDTTVNSSLIGISQMSPLSLVYAQS